MSYNQDIQAVGHFKYWCQKVLPAVYDDSLSYYELLCKVSNKLNELVDVDNVQSDAIKELQEKLDEFLAGEYDPYIEQKIDEWFQQNEPQLYIDVQTLKIEVSDLQNALQKTDLHELEAIMDMSTYIEDGALYIENILPGTYTTANLELSGITLDNVFGASIITNSDMEDGNPPVFDGTAFSNYSANPWSVASGYGYCGAYGIKMESSGVYPCYLSSKSFTPIADHVYFFGSKVKIERYDDGTFGVQNAAYTQYLAPGDTAGEWIDMNQQGVYSSITAKHLYIGCVPVSNLVVIGTQPNMDAAIDCIVFIDLTDLYGAGNEPNIDDMNLAYDVYWCLKNNENYLNKHLVNLHPTSPDYSDYACFDRFLLLMNERATELRMDDTDFNTPSGYPSIRGNNLMTAFDLMKLGITACGNDNALRHMSVGRHIFECWGDSPRRNVMTFGLVNSQYSGGVTLTNKILAAKGGSLSAPASGLSDNATIHNYFILTTLVPTSSIVHDSYAYQRTGNIIAVSMMGLVDTDNVYDYLVDVQTILNALANHVASPTVPTRLQDAIDRSTNPIEVASCILPSGLLGSYQYMDMASFTTNTVTWFSGATFTPHVPASTTKIMTLLLACEHMDSPNEIVTIKPFDLVAGSGGILHAGDQVTMDELMYSMMLISDNQAATAIARYIGEKLLKNRL